MRGRRKRSRVVSSPVRTRRRRIEPVVSHSRTRSCSRHGEEDGDRQQPDYDTSDSVLFASRSSVKLIHEVVSKFDSEKRGLVESTGFHGILHFPPMKQFDRKFVLWLMSCVNVENCTLTVSEEISIKFGKVDVGSVLGIPSSGRRIIDSSIPTREAKQVVLDSILGPDFKEMRSIKVVQELLVRDYRRPMSKKEADTFRVAFIVFVVSNLLAPSAKYDYASIDYWNAIQDPDDIRSYDWSEYVIVRLLDAVSKLRKDLASNIKFPNITGCSVFLQAWYLDSLDLGSESLVHNVTPRIRLFTYEKMRAMIAADSNYARHINSDSGMASVKLRDPSGCIYTWAMEKSPEIEDSPAGIMLAIWESAVAMVHLLNIPLEAAGPVFVAVANFQNQINAGLVATGTLALKVMSVLVSIMMPYMRGFSYQSSYSRGYEQSGYGELGGSLRKGIEIMARPIRNKLKQCVSKDGGQGCPQYQCRRATVTWQGRHDYEASSSNQARPYLEHSQIGDNVQRAMQSAAHSLDSLPHYMNVNLRVATAMSQFYSLIRKMKHPRGFDLNCFAPDEATFSPTGTLPVVGEVESLPSPWELGFLWSVSDSDCSSLRDMLNRMDDDEGLVIVHESPKHIQVSFAALREQLMARCEMELDLFDALIRSLCQRDDYLYSSFGCLRWRLFFESDFMGDIVSGSFDLVDPKLSEQLRLPKATYDISRCKLVFFPVLLQFSWVCYVWAPGENVLYVFEPSYVQPLPESRLEAIERAGYLLKLALQNLRVSVFNGCSKEVSFAEMRLITIRDASLSRLNRSGLICSYFCRCYDGVNLDPTPSEVGSYAIAARLLVDAIELKENHGILSYAM